MKTDIISTCSSVPSHCSVPTLRISVAVKNIIAVKHFKRSIFHLQILRYNFSLKILKYLFVNVTFFYLFNF